MRSLCLFFAAWALVSCASSPKIKLPTDQERFSQMYIESGTEYLLQEKYSEALSSFLEAIKYNSRSPIAWSNMGLAYYGLKETQKARDAWQKAVEVDPKFTEAKLNLGAMFLDQGKFSLAEEKLKDVVKDLLYTKAYLAHFNLAQVYFKQGKSLLAEHHLNMAVRTNKTYCIAWMQLGYLSKDRGDFASAAKHFTQATMGTCYNNPEAHYQMGKTLLKTGDHKNARSKFLELVQNFARTDWAAKAERELSALYLEEP